VILAPIANGVAHAAYDVMEAWVKERRDLAPAGMKSMFQVTNILSYYYISILVEAWVEKCRNLAPARIKSVFQVTNILSY